MLVDSQSESPNLVFFNPDLETLSPIKGCSQLRINQLLTTYQGVHITLLYVKITKKVILPNFGYMQPPKACENIQQALFFKLSSILHKSDYQTTKIYCLILS